MIKIIFLGVLVYLLVRLLKSLRGSSPLGPKEFRKNEPAGRLGGEMVKDPQCHVYVPKHEAVSRVVDGREVYFCSERCMEEYLESKKKTN